MDALILPVFQSRIARGYSNVQPDLFIYIDEGSKLIETDDATISQWIGLIRGVGLSLLISNQSAVSLSQKVLSNIPNIFIAKSSFSDLNVMASSIGLDAHQKRYLSLHLKPGLLLGRLAQSSWRYPFLFTTPLIEAPPIDQSLNHDNNLDSLAVIAAPEFLNWEPDWARPKTIIPTQQTDGSETRPEHANETPHHTNLTPDETRLVEMVIAHPCQPVSFFPTKLHMGKRKIASLRKSLIVKQMIQEQPTQTNGRGRPAILLAPTDQALRLFQTTRP